MLETSSGDQNTIRRSMRTGVRGISRLDVDVEIYLPLIVCRGDIGGCQRKNRFAARDNMGSMVRVGVAEYYERGPSAVSTVSK